MLVQIYSHPITAGSLLIVPACLLNDNQSLLGLCLTLSLITSNVKSPVIVFSCYCHLSLETWFYMYFYSQSNLYYCVVLCWTSNFLSRPHKLKFYTDSMEITLGWLSVPYGLDRCRCHHQRTRWAIYMLPPDSLIYSKFPSCGLCSLSFSTGEKNPLR